VADPHHVEPLTSFDRLTVGLYRAGLVIAAFGVAWTAFALAWREPTLVPRWTTLVGVGLVVANLHLYDPVIRWVIVASGWLGVVLVAVVPIVGATLAPWPDTAGLGFLFVVLSAVALKERYCFRLPLVVAVPPLLAGALLPLLLGLDGIAAVVLGAAAAVLGLLALRKLAMPLHYDIGDKSKYQV
jgi:uncharacterized integral membrane protein